MALFKKKEKQVEEKLTWQQNVLVTFRDIIYVLAAFMVVYMLFFRTVVVVGPSMNNTLVDGDRLVLLSNSLYKQPKQGDIIVASKDSFRGGECIVKRVIATEGQWVSFDATTGVIMVDGRVLDESDYLSIIPHYNNQKSFSKQVPEGKVFVMGDNRDNSLDSRSEQIGFIDEREILGKAIFLMWPGDKQGTQEPSFDRIGAVD
jgi:signal peptidase I